ncbi:poly-beta-1,6-N-acetyl-D-glucosamine N-deacetylase PgaB [Marilutibacter alkalisoli]|uniref:Poly-beta-1,6-N-acetyl-D-glucosamine N-deacetylase PgaB n=1 Tax=Marilutibacter alkalisoli TaxID=2591633 RepID=A0A514BSP5_9GAMM|nr:poly-beta-1,6-N-acetyl-D-glucosamine N-deacetylase PgaB [Lysobacter alkalisoli]QDH70403.1 poly-beta-1,6-N-acetyl-D-glucosamine N-deacetylase PgaB [Lysobacter alkalisoli]
MSRTDMKRTLVLALCALALLAATLVSGRAGAAELLIISYHDIRDDIARKGDPDQYAVSTQNFAAHLDWLAGHGYRPVALDDVIAASRGERPLPDKAVLLTFDDGLRSVHTHAFPLLRAYGYPALVAVVTDWVDLPPHRQIDYGPRMFTGDDFLTWDQLREMQASGLVEVASHSHDLHHGVNANPQGNSTPAAVTRIFDPERQRYESEAEYLARIRDDLSTSASLIERELGHRPRAMVWPYAAYNSQVNAIADALGMTVTFDLEGRSQAITAGMHGNGLHGLARLLLFDNPGIDDLAYELRHDEQLEGMRALQIDLDYVYDADAAQMERNLDALIERVKQIGPNHVFLQAFADPDGNGSADALYFPNRHLPLRADLFNRVAWQLRTRAGVKVFAWLPVLGYELPDARLRGSLAIESSNPAETFRLDPFQPEARRIIAEVYEDLAASSYFEGLLFHDDALLREDELADAAPSTPAARTQALIDFTLELRDAAGKWRPKLQTVRNLFAAPVLQPESEAWFAQRLDAFNAAYDYTAVMAMPWMEGSARPQAWLDRLVKEVWRHPGAPERTVFELQTVDWNTGRPIPADLLKAQVRRLQAQGVRHLAWYPDNFIDDVPPMSDAREAISARSFPYLEP